MTKWKQKKSLQNYTLSFVVSMTIQKELKKEVVYRIMDKYSEMTMNTRYFRDYDRWNFI